MTLRGVLWSWVLLGASCQQPPSAPTRPSVAPADCDSTTDGAASIDALVGGHWTVMDGSHGDPAGSVVLFERARYFPEMYRWGSGHVEGLELDRASTARVFRNVNCSDESSDYSDATWHPLGARCFELETSSTKWRYRIQRQELDRVWLEDVEH